MKVAGEVMWACEQLPVPNSGMISLMVAWHRDTIARTLWKRWPSMGVSFQRSNSRGIPLVRDYRTLFRTAEFASRLASTLSSRGMCDMEKASERANFWHVQCRE